MLAETPTEAGQPVTRSFTVNVRTPEGEPTGPDGAAGLDLVVGGSAPAPAGIRVTPAGRHTRQIFLAAAHDVPLIDLTAKTKALVESLGVEGSKALYLYNEKRDNTHTSARGATAYAELVRDELLAQSLVPGHLVR
jgi:hypothetical protein